LALERRRPMPAVDRRRWREREIARRTMQLLALYRVISWAKWKCRVGAVVTRSAARALRAQRRRIGPAAGAARSSELAIALYRAALEQDNLADELYQRLIECHLARGEHAQALNVYRRCRSCSRSFSPEAIGAHRALVAPLLIVDRLGHSGSRLPASARAPTVARTDGNTQCFDGGGRAAATVADAKQASDYGRCNCASSYCGQRGARGDYFGSQRNSINAGNRRARCARMPAPARHELVGAFDHHAQPP